MPDPMTQLPDHERGHRSPCPLSSRLSGLSLSLVAFLVSGCEGRQAPPAAEPQFTGAPPPEMPAATAINPGWDSAAGHVMLVAVTRGAADVHVVLPALTDSSLAALSGVDVQSLSGMPADLFSKGGFAGTSTLSLAGGAEVPENCVAWPSGRITGDPPARWRVGFEKGRAVGVALDSIEAMERGDSISVVSELIRIASALPATADPTFSGLPFSVVRAYRMTAGPVSAVIATVVRRINEEANPRQEHLLLVIERPAQASPYVPAYYIRSAGQEESLQTSEILAAVRFAENGRIAIVTTLDREEGGRLGLLERVGSARWRLVWRSAYAGC